MVTTIVDTSVWIDLLRGHNNDRARLLERMIDTRVAIGITDITYAELHAGMLAENGIAMLSQLESAGRILSLQGLEDFARAGELARAATLAGRPVRSISDCLIASVCIREDLPLLHHDRDFESLAACSPLRTIAV